MKLIKDENFLFPVFFLEVFKSIIPEKMKSTVNFFPVIKIGPVGITEMTKTRLSIVADLS